VDVPQIHHVEAITEVPKPTVQQVPKQVPKYELRAQEKIVEVPTTLRVEQAIEVPQVLVAEVITQVPRVEVQYIDREIPVIRTEAREQIVEVPQVCHEERLIEVPQVQVAEFIKQVPLQQVQEVPKEIPKVETRAVEKIVPIAQNLIQEVAVEVPQVMTQEVLKQIPSHSAEQRIVQTGIEFERPIDRQQALREGSLGIGESHYAGVYTAQADPIYGMSTMPGSLAGSYAHGTLMGSTHGVGGSYTAGGYPTTYGAPPVSGAMSAFDMIDRNHDGVITRGEFQQAGFM